MSIVDMNGRPISSDPNQQNKKQQKVTKAQAGAIITSEIDMALETWNKAAREAHKDDLDKAPIFESHFDKFEYTPAVKEKSQLFGYAKLSIKLSVEGRTKEIYSKGINFAKEQELNNTNGYFPDMIFDCIGFLIASGLMYNLALNKEAANAKDPKNATAKGNKPGAAAKSKS